MQSKQTTFQKCWLTVHMHGECYLSVGEWGAVEVWSALPYIATVLAAAKLQWRETACLPSTCKKTSRRSLSKKLARSPKRYLVFQKHVNVSTLPHFVAIIANICLRYK